MLKVLSATLNASILLRPAASVVLLMGSSADLDQKAKLQALQYRCVSQTRRSELHRNCERVAAGPSSTRHLDSRLHFARLICLE